MPNLLYGLLHLTHTAISQDMVYHYSRIIDEKPKLHILAWMVWSAKVLKHDTCLKVCD